MKLNRSSGKGLRGAFVSLIIIVLFSTVALIVFFRGGSEGDNPIKDSMDRSKGVACMAQRKIMEDIIQIFYTDKGRFPHNLAEVESFEESNLSCPVTYDQYVYDAQIGKVTCPDHP